MRGFFLTMKKEGLQKGLPPLEKVIENAKRLKASGLAEGVKVVVHPEGFNLTIDEGLPIHKKDSPLHG